MATEEDSMQSAWRSKSDEQIADAATHLDDYTQEGKNIVRSELKRRGLAEPPPVAHGSATGNTSEPVERPTEGGTRKCPYCAEVIQAAAIKCRYCGESLDTILQKKSSGTAITVGGIGLALAAFGLLLPYFMAVLFVPVGLICSFYAFARKARLLGGIGVLVGLLGIVGIVSTSQRLTEIGGDSSKSHHVRYALDGTASEAQITIQNSAGGTEQHTVSVPWSKEFEAPGGSFVYLSGQNQGSGRLKAAIYVDGVLLQEAETTEQFGIASVSGTAK